MFMLKWTVSVIFNSLPFKNEHPWFKTSRKVSVKISGMYGSELCAVNSTRIKVTFIRGNPWMFYVLFPTAF